MGTLLDVHLHLQTLPGALKEANQQRIAGLTATEAQKIRMELLQIVRDLKEERTISASLRNKFNLFNKSLRIVQLDDSWASRVLLQSRLTGESRG